jgi:hypothetical protein
VHRRSYIGSVLGNFGVLEWSVRYDVGHDVSRANGWSGPARLGNTILQHTLHRTGVFSRCMHRPTYVLFLLPQVEPQVEPLVSRLSFWRISVPACQCKARYKCQFLIGLDSHNVHSSRGRPQRVLFLSPRQPHFYQLRDAIHYYLTPFRLFATPTMLPGPLTAILRTLLLVTPVFSANATDWSSRSIYQVTRRCIRAWCASHRIA